MMTTPRITVARLLVLGFVSMLAGCATTQMNAEWRDAAFAATSLKGQRVLVVCRAPDDTMRRVCEDQWASQLGAQGVAPVRSYSIPGFPWASGDNADEMKAAVRASGAAALATMSLAPSDFAVVNPGAQVGVGIGGGSGGGYRSGGFSFGGFGISFPIGGATATQGLGATSSLVDVASGKVVWSGSASTSASSDILGQVGALTQVTIEAMRKAGLI
jgi:uncharacterized membrane protein YgcG